MTAYGKLEYWEERYKRDAEPFDWFQRYAGLKPILLETGLKASSRILVLGCGTSRVSEELYADGFVNLMNIDFSPVCISHMQKRCADRQEMKFVEMNALDMRAFAPHSYDIVFDKGTMDCILCGDNSFDNVQKMLREVSRVLAPGGSYIVVSYGQPNFRLSHLQREELGWTVVMKTIQKPSLSVQDARRHIPKCSRREYMNKEKKDTSEDAENSDAIIYGNMSALVYLKPPIDEKDNVHYIYICTKPGDPAESGTAEAEQGNESASGTHTVHATGLVSSADEGDGAGTTSDGAKDVPDSAATSR